MLQPRKYHPLYPKSSIPHGDAPDLFVFVIGYIINFFLFLLLFSGLTQAHVKVCAFLLDRGAETEAQTNDASTPLHYFVRMDPEDILEFHKVSSTTVKLSSP